MADPGLEPIAQYLLDSKKSRVYNHHGVCLGKKIRFFRGRRGLQALLDESFRQHLPEAAPIQNKAEAKRLLESLIENNFLLPAEKVKGKVLQPISFKDYHDERHYVWLYQDPTSQRNALIKNLLIIVAGLIALSYPLWTDQIRQAMWYLTVIGMGLFSLLILILIIRIPLFYLSRIFLPPGFWIFPNITEDVSIADSFVPLWDWDHPGKVRRGLRRRRWKWRGDDHAGSGSENRSGLDGSIDDGFGGEPPSSAGGTEGSAASSSSSHRGFAGDSPEGFSGEIRKRNLPASFLKGLSGELRLDSENDGDNEGGTDNDVEDRSPLKRRDPKDD